MNLPVYPVPGAAVSIEPGHVDGGHELAFDLFFAFPVGPQLPIPEPARVDVSPPAVAVLVDALDVLTYRALIVLENGSFAL